METVGLEYVIKRLQKDGSRVYSSQYRKDQDGYTYLDLIIQHPCSLQKCGHSLRVENPETPNVFNKKIIKAATGPETRAMLRNFLK